METHSATSVEKAVPAGPNAESVCWAVVTNSALEDTSLKLLTTVQ